MKFMEETLNKPYLSQGPRSAARVTRLMSSM
jgi:hypothetical protein